MANINNYLEWRGDLNLKIDGFNEIDSLILARFSYLPLDKIKLDKKETVKSINKKLNLLNINDFRFKEDKLMANLMAKSIRFSNLEVSDYIKKDDKKAEKQFGAVTIHLSDKELYVSFLGTDGSINGWKEDFNMSFMDDISCQIEGKKYLQSISDKYKNTTLRVGGHSKGGNVAIYSSVRSSETIKNRIIKVYNYDGPGFSNHFIDKYFDSNFTSKIETYLPEDSFVGRILNHKSKISVTKSVSKGVNQHDIYSWQVLGTNLIYSKSTTNNSEDFYKTIKEWLNDTVPEKRKLFFDIVFELLYSSEKENISEITSDITKTFPKIMKKYSKLSKEEKNTVIQMIGLFVKKYIDIRGNREKLKIIKNEK